MLFADIMGAVGKFSSSDEGILSHTETSSVIGRHMRIVNRAGVNSVIGAIRTCWTSEKSPNCFPVCMMALEMRLSPRQQSGKLARR